MKILLLLILSSISICQVKIKPVFTFSYLSKGSDYYYAENSISIFGAGVRFNYYNDNLDIHALFLNHRLWGVPFREKKYYNSFNHNQGLSWAQDPTQSGNSFDYDFANLKINYYYNNSTFFIGKINPQWGEGYSKLNFSNKAPSFPLFGFNWKINKNLSIEYFHGQLNSKIVDSSYYMYYDDDLNINKIPTINRNVAAHKIIWDLTEKIRINAMETVIYGVRGIDFHYLMPIIPFWSLQHYLGDTDNIQMSAEVIFSPSQNFRFYGTLFIDEWSPGQTFSKENRNWFAYQFGFVSKYLFSKMDKLRLEFTWTDRRVFHHRFDINDYYSHGFPLGFWGGPHAQEIYFSYQIKLDKLKFIMQASNAKRGQIIYQYNEEIYEFRRFDGITEEKSFIEFEIIKNLYKNISLRLSISNIQWKNPGFNPFEDYDQYFENKIYKNSLNLGINYNN